MKNLIIALLAILVLVLFFRSCGKDKTDWKAKYEYEHQKFDSLKNQQKAVVTENQKLVNKITGKKKSQAYFKADQVVVYHDTVPVPYEVIRDTCRNIDRTFRNDSISGRINDEGVTIDSLRLSNSIAFKVFEKKRSILVEASNTNPAFRITGMNSIMLKKKQPSRIGIGPYVGWDFLNKRPAAGLSLTYQIIRL